MFCKKCGAKIEDGASFCTNCGSPVDSADQNAEQWQAYDDNTPMVSQMDGHGTQKRSGKKKFPIIAGIVIAAIVVLVAVGVFILLAKRSDDESVSADASGETVEADPGVSDEEESGTEADEGEETVEEEGETVAEDAGGADEAADAEEEPAEEEEVEEKPIAEEKTVDLDAVMKAYESYIKYTYEKDSRYENYPIDSYYLVCLNDDDIPELLISGQGGELKSLSILSYSVDTGDVFFQFGAKGLNDNYVLCYDERENHFGTYHYSASFIDNTLVSETEEWVLYQIAKVGNIESIGYVERTENTAWVRFSIPNRVNTTEEIYTDYVENNCKFASEIGDYLDMYRTIEEAYAAYLEG